MLPMKLVASDLDGTLLDDGKRISRGNRRAIERARAAGVHFMIASGRMAFSALAYADELGLTAPLVAMNGAHVVDPASGSTLYARFMDPEPVLAICRAAKEMGLYFSVYERYDLWGSEMRYSAASYSRLAHEQRGARLPVAVHIEPDPEKMTAFTRGEVIKCLVADEDPEKLAACRKKLEARGDIAIVSSWYDNFEIMGVGTDKIDGVRFAANYLDIPMERVMTLGDSENDWGMLRGAGWGVAMGNADEKTKSQADRVTLDNDHDGVAGAIEAFCLKGEF